MSRILRFEFHATQPQVLIDFYTAVFGWQFTKVEPGGWWKIHTGAQDGPAIPGGMQQRPCAASGSSPSLNAFACTVEVEDLGEALAKSLRMGAVPALPRMAVPHVGWLAYIKDPDGNLLGLMQLDPRAA